MDESPYSHEPRNTNDVQSITLNIKASPVRFGHTCTTVVIDNNTSDRTQQNTLRIKRGKLSDSFDRHGKEMTTADGVITSYF